MLFLTSLEKYLRFSLCSNLNCSTQNNSFTYQGLDQFPPQLIRTLITKWIILSWATKVWAKRKLCNLNVRSKKDKQYADTTLFICLMLHLALLKLYLIMADSKSFIFFSRPEISNRISTKFFVIVSCSALTKQTISV